jgi:hypothetical protein
MDHKRRGSEVADSLDEPQRLVDDADFGRLAGGPANGSGQDGDQRSDAPRERNAVMSNGKKTGGRDRPDVVRPRASRGVRIAVARQSPPRSGGRYEPDVRQNPRSFMEDRPPLGVSPHPARPTPIRRRRDPTTSRAPTSLRAWSRSFAPQNSLASAGRPAMSLWLRASSRSCTSADPPASRSSPSTPTSSGSAKQLGHQVAGFACACGSDRVPPRSGQLACSRLRLRAAFAAELSRSASSASRRLAA